MWQPGTSTMPVHLDTIGWSVSSRWRTRTALRLQTEARSQNEARAWRRQPPHKYCRSDVRSRCQPQGASSSSLLWRASAVGLRCIAADVEIRAHHGCGDPLARHLCCIPAAAPRNIAPLSAHYRSGPQTAYVQLALGGTTRLRPRPRPRTSA